MGRPRISLITLIVAVNVTGVLVWANVRVDGPFLSTVDETFSYPDNFQWSRCRGWPLHFQEVERHDYIGYRKMRSEDIPKVNGRVVDYKDIPFGQFIGQAGYWRTVYLAVNVCMALLIIGFAGLASECLVRELRKAKRHDE